MTSGTTSVERVAASSRITLPFQVDLLQVLGPHRRGKFDPCQRVTADGAVWRTSLQRSGAVSARIAAVSARIAVSDSPGPASAVDCEVWGPGGPEFLDGLPALLGAEDAPAGYRPADPTLAEARRRCPDLRIGRTGRVFEALAPAILEQRVQRVSAHASWCRLVTRFGAPAPGPVPDGMRLPPSPEVWRRVPSWEFHRANVDPQRARTLVRCAQRADAIERLADGGPSRFHAAVRTLPGVGVWTAAETAQRALGDADALSVGDFHLAAMVGWTLLGRPIDDDEMIELLEPVRPHRHRAVALLWASGLAHKPKFAPRLSIRDIRCQ